MEVRLLAVILVDHWEGGVEKSGLASVITAVASCDMSLALFWVISFLCVYQILVLVDEYSFLYTPLPPPSWKQ